MSQRSEAAAQAVYNAILDLLRREDEETIYDYPLSVEVRSDWAPYAHIIEPTEYRILISTGGPAVAIQGDINLFDEAETARLLYCDQGEPWTEYTPVDPKVLLEFASYFIHGD